jgi:hypothetical protein
MFNAPLVEALQPMPLDWQPYDFYEYSITLHFKGKDVFLTIVASATNSIKKSPARTKNPVCRLAKWPNFPTINGPEKYPAPHAK